MLSEDHMHRNVLDSGGARANVTGSWGYLELPIPMSSPMRTNTTGIFNSFLIPTMQF